MCPDLTTMLWLHIWVVRGEGKKKNHHYGKIEYLYETTLTPWCRKSGQPWCQQLVHTLPAKTKEQMDEFEPEKESVPTWSSIDDRGDAAPVGRGPRGPRHADGLRAHRLDPAKTQFSQPWWERPWTASSLTWPSSSTKSWYWVPHQSFFWPVLVSHGDSGMLMGSECTGWILPTTTTQLTVSQAGKDFGEHQSNLQPPHQLNHGTEYQVKSFFKQVQGWWLPGQTIAVTTWTRSKGPIPPKPQSVGTSAAI